MKNPEPNKSRIWFSQQKFKKVGSSLKGEGFSERGEVRTIFKGQNFQIFLETKLRHFDVNLLENETNKCVYQKKSTFRDNNKHANRPWSLT